MNTNDEIQSLQCLTISPQNSFAPLPPKQRRTYKNNPFEYFIPLIRCSAQTEIFPHFFLNPFSSSLCWSLLLSDQQRKQPRNACCPVKKTPPKLRAQGGENGKKVRTFDVELTKPRSAAVYLDVASDLFSRFHRFLAGSTETWGNGVSFRDKSHEHRAVG